MMRVSFTRCFLCWIMAVLAAQSLLAQDLPAHAGGAILHTQGGVWVNGAEAHDSTAIFPGDLIETKPGASADLSFEGTSALIAPESVAKFQGDSLELDHGGVSISTSRAFQVQVNCIRIAPTPKGDERVQFSITDLNGVVQVAARTGNLNVGHEKTRDKSANDTDSSQPALVPEGHQQSYDESAVCGQRKPTGAGMPVSPKWLIAGGGAALLLLLLTHGGGNGNKTSISPSSP
jgi:hypothetical protein